LSSGEDVVNLEFCTGSENSIVGLLFGSSSALSAMRYSNCIVANNGGFGVNNGGSGTIKSHGNNTITGNGLGATNGTIGSFSGI
jgi:hypothetical protein